MSRNFFDITTDDDPSPIIPPPPVLNGHDEPPPPASETSYGVVNPKTGGKPVIEVLPPEFADDALALNFSDAYGDSLRYVSAWGRWYIWDGQVWRHDDTLHVRDLIRRTCRAYSVNAPPAAQKAATSKATVMAVEMLAQSDRRHAATVDQWDADPWLLNTPGGVWDLRAQEMLPHEPSRHMMKMTSVAPGGDCPLWRKFLDRVTNEDQGLIDYLQRVAGYCLTGVTSEHAMFFAYGTGRNGKGVFLNTISRIMGDYAVSADPDTFTASGQGKHLTVLARLQGARLVVAQETEEGVPWAEARIKAITGGDPITANFMRRDPTTFTPVLKLVVAGNHKPSLRAVDEAIRARFNLIPFTVTIPEGERDPDLANKLLSEAPGILAWMLDGCREFTNIRLSPPLVVTEATNLYFETEDIFSQWMTECLEVGGQYHRAGATELYESWKAWSASAGEGRMSQKQFGQALEAKGYTRKKTNRGWEYVGVSIPILRHHSETDW